MEEAGDHLKAQGTKAKDNGTKARDAVLHS
jgi:hypothetical protein